MRKLAQNFGFCENSVKQALKRLFRKLEVSNRAAMVGKLQDIFVPGDRKSFNLKK
jgi:DNA-binding CsgD family transcriptional regulator